MRHHTSESDAWRMRRRPAVRQELIRACGPVSDHDATVTRDTYALTLMVRDVLAGAGVRFRAARCAVTR